MSYKAIGALIFFALMASAGAFGAYGWLFNISDGVSRLRARCLADGLLAVAFFWGGSAVETSLWWRIGNYVVGSIGIMQARAWWRKWELARRFEREVDKHQRRRQIWQ